MEVTRAGTRARLPPAVPPSPDRIRTGMNLKDEHANSLQFLKCALVSKLTFRRMGNDGPAQWVVTVVVTNQVHSKFDHADSRLSPTE